MESYNTIFFQKLRACNEWKQERSKIVWTDFVAVYPILNSIHRCVKNNILNLLLIFILVSDLFVSLKHTQKIIKNNALFVMVEDDLYSSQPTNLMLQTNSKCTRNMEKELQIIFERKNIFSLLLWLNEVKINIPNACKILINSKVASLHVRAKINTISQFKMREREKEKRETACGEIQKMLLAARNLSQHATERVAAKNFIQAENSSNLVLAADVNQLGSKVHLAGADVNQLGNKVNLAGADVNQLGSKVHLAGADVNQLGSKVDLVGADVNQLGSRVDLVGADVNQLGSKVNLVGADVNRLGSKVDLVGADVNQLGSKVDLAGADVNQLGSKVDLASADVNQLGSKVDLASADVNQLGSKVDPVAADVNQLGSRVGLMPVDVNRLVCKCHHLAGKIHSRRENDLKSG